MIKIAIIPVEWILILINKTKQKSWKFFIGKIIGFLEREVKEKIKDEERI